MIEIKNLNFSYKKGNIVLSNISIKINAGEKVAVIGPSGSGKSTFLKCLNGLLSLDNGIVTVLDSCPEDKQWRHTQAKIGMIFQNYNLLQRSTVFDNVLQGRLGYIPLWRRYLYGFCFSRNDQEIAMQSLAQVGLDNFWNRRVDQLSGGQQQRVGIARALSQKPKLILADEPVSNLDPETKQKVLEMLISICEKRKIAIIISMHEIKLVKIYVNRVIGLKGGKKVFDGKTEEFDKKIYKEIYTN